MDNWNAKQRIIVQGVCVLLSVILWFYVTNIENPLKSIELNRVDVQLINTSKLTENGLVLAPNQDIYITLKLEGNIQDIYKVSKEDFDIRIDLEPYALKEGENIIPVTIVDAPSNVTIKNSTGLTATVVVETLAEKEVAVESSINITAKSGYYVEPVLCEPSTVTVSGPKSLVDIVDKVIVAGTENEVEQTIVKNYDLMAVDSSGNKVSGVTFSQDNVQVTIRVNQGKVVAVNLVTTGELPSGLELQTTSLSSEQVELSGPEEILSSINSINTEPLDLSKIKEDSQVELSLIIPDGVKSETGETVIVNITVDKIDTKEISVRFTEGNIPEGMNIATDSDTIKVTISGYKKDLDKITEDDLSAVLDLSSVTAAGEYELQPTVTFNEEKTNVTIEKSDSIKVTATTATEESNDENADTATSTDVDTGDSSEENQE